VGIDVLIFSGSGQEQESLSKKQEQSRSLKYVTRPVATGGIREQFPSQ